MDNGTLIKAFAGLMLAWVVEAAELAVSISLLVHGDVGLGNGDVEVSDCEAECARGLANRDDVGGEDEGGFC